MYYKNHLKTFIVILIIFSILFLIVLFSSRKTLDYVDNYSNLTPVKEHLTFFAIENNINKYLSLLDNKDYEAIYNMLDESYITKNHITEKNLKKKMDFYNGSLNISVKEMLSASIDNSIIYLIKGSLIDNSEMDETVIVKEDYYIIIKVDYDNFTVSFFPTTKDYRDDINTINGDKIQNNYNNGYAKGGLISDDNICLLYLNEFIDYKEKIDETYNNLDERNKINYSTKEELKEYLNNYNFDASLSSCEITNIEDKYNIIKITDTNNNYFEITETAVLKYKIYFELNAG